MARKKYFNNPLVTQWIIDYRNTGDETLRENALTEIFKIVPAVIFLKRFHKFEPYDDCFSDGIEAVLKSFDKFDPNFITKSGKKATAFNYFTKVIQQSIFYFTLRNKKNRNTKGIDDLKKSQIDYNDHEESIDLVITDFKSPYLSLFERYKIRHLKPAFLFLCDYLKKYRSFNKRLFYKSIQQSEFGILTDTHGKPITENLTFNNFSRKMLQVLKDNKAKFLVR